MSWDQELYRQLEKWQSTLERKSDIHLQKEARKLSKIMEDLQSMDMDKGELMDRNKVQQVFERLFEHFQLVDRYIFSSKKKLPLSLYKYCTNQVIHKKLPLVQEELKEKIEEQQKLKRQMDIIEQSFVHSFHDIEEANSFVETIVKNHHFYYEQFTLFEAWKHLLYKPYKNLQTFASELEEQMDDLIAEYTSITKAWGSLTARELQKKTLLRDFASRQDSYNDAREKLKDSFDVYLSMQELQKEYFEGYFSLVREYMLEYYQSLIEESMDIEERWSRRLTKIKRELLSIPLANLLGISSLEKFMQTFQLTFDSFFQSDYVELEAIPAYQKTKNLAAEIAASLSLSSTKEYFEAKGKVKQLLSERKRAFVSYQLHDRKLCPQSLFRMEEGFLTSGIFGIESRIQKLTLLSKDMEKKIGVERDKRAFI